MEAGGSLDLFGKKYRKVEACPSGPRLLVGLEGRGWAMTAGPTRASAPRALRLQLSASPRCVPVASDLAGHARWGYGRVGNSQPLRF